MKMCLTLIGLILLWLSNADAQNKLPVLRSDSSYLSMRVDTTYYPKRWTISPQLRPDESVVTVYKNPVRVAFIANQDSIVHVVNAGDVFDFVVVTPGKDSAFTRIKGVKFIEPAQFNAAYIQTHRGKTFVEIPDVYELVNVVFALTDAAKTNNDLVRKDTPYYQEVIKYFSPYKKEPIVALIDSLLTKDDNSYFPLKMDAYAFAFDRKGTIQQSPVYDRLTWGRENSLREYLPQLTQFAAKSKFTDFIEKHKPYYDHLIEVYRDSLGVAAMQTWLNNNFPDTRYDSFKIIFSPLVSWNQSANWFENNGFREAQAHVNFPFPDESDKASSKQAVNVRNGNIVFTELNHAFINPEGEKSAYKNALESAFKNLNFWLDMTKPARNYSNVYACFNEYMNWGLVSLRYVDLAPKDEQSALIKNIETMMVNGRGFKRFAEYNQYLIQLYKNRPSGTTVADLYPKIVKWFDANKPQN